VHGGRLARTYRACQAGAQEKQGEAMIYHSASTSASGGPSPGAASVGSHRRHGGEQLRAEEETETREQERAGSVSV
jgi:hypothetical protein